MYDFVLIIPCLNEAPRIATTHAALVDFFSQDFWRGKSIALVFVNDGSQDDTAAAMNTLPRDGVVNTHVVSYAMNLGKGAAVMRGAQAVEAQAYGFVDADLAFPLSHLNEMYAGLAHADLVVGQRSALLHPTMRARLRWLMSRSLQALAAWWLRLPVRDTQCGMKVFSRRVVQEIFPNIFQQQFSFDVELILRTVRAHMRVASIPVAFQYHSSSSVRGRDGLRYIRDLWRLRTLDEKLHN